MPVTIGKPAPSFEATALVDGKITKVSLEQFSGKYVVLFFYPADWTFICPTEIHAFSDRIQEFKDINCEVLGCSVDNVHSHLHWAQTPRNKGGLGGCTFPLLSDITKSIAQDYGCLVDFGDDAGLALRALYIISPTGVVRQATVNDMPVGRSIDETLRLVRAFQFTDEHGEVCPANWTPGAKTMKDDPVGSLDYFNSL
ncbi:unnamed protein product [Pedinophyceae sp. YPF-701]|nr:unnamed protein product [Pedinophyceae sp. YPF-701]